MGLEGPLVCNLACQPLDFYILFHGFLVLDIYEAQVGELHNRQCAISTSNINSCTLHYVFDLTSGFIKCFKKPFLWKKHKKSNTHIVINAYFDKIWLQFSFPMSQLWITLTLPMTGMSTVPYESAIQWTSPLKKSAVTTPATTEQNRTDWLVFVISKVILDKSLNNIIVISNLHNNFH